MCPTKTTHIVYYCIFGGVNMEQFYTTKKKYKQVGLNQTKNLPHRKRKLLPPWKKEEALIGKKRTYFPPYLPLTLPTLAFTPENKKQHLQW